LVNDVPDGQSQVVLIEDNTVVRPTQW